MFRLFDESPTKKEDKIILFEKFYLSQNIKNNLFNPP